MRALIRVALVTHFVHKWCWREVGGRAGLVQTEKRIQGSMDLGPLSAWAGWVVSVVVTGSTGVEDVCLPSSEIDKNNEGTTV